MTVATPREPGHRATIDVPSWLAYAYAPILPLLKRAIRLRRAGGRGYRPRDILLPRGYMAEVLTAGLNTPVHCCFDDQGSCYEWYGWPDFASGVRLDDPRWGAGGAGREPVLAIHPMSLAPEHATAAGADASAVADRYRPPFVLTSDMLVVAALVRTADLRRGFPGIPFLSILGCTPLVVWFSRITESCYHDQAGEWRCERSSSSEGIYSEVNVLGLLRRRAVFVPAIYASEARTVQVGRHYYGMPKHLAQTDVHVGNGRFEGTLVDGARRSVVQARLLGGGRGPGAVVSRLWPRPTWPIHFPSGGQVRALVLATPRVQLARVWAGHIAVPAPWQATPRRLLPIGVYVRGLRMHLPAVESLPGRGSSG